MVATGTELYQQLVLHFDVNRYFQATLPMNRLSAQEITESILIRHGATQMQLVDAQDELLEIDRIERLARRVAVNARGHIGQALRQWVYDMHYVDEATIRYLPETPLALPAELTKDAAILLRTLLLDRTASEYELRQRFGPRFRTIFQPLIQRYLHLGLLRRRSNGFLEINPVIAGDLERELTRTNYLPKPTGNATQRL